MKPPAVSGPKSLPRILVVDDDEGLLILMAESLRAEGYEVATAGSGHAALKWLESHRPSLMLLDLKLSDLDAPVLLERLRRDERPVPFVVVTGQGDEKAAVEMMRQGALDYVMKSTGLLDLLPNVVRRALTAITQGEELVAAQREHRRLEAEIISVGERERHSIGADLHDNLGQQLTAIELMCSALKMDAAGHPPLARGLEELARLLREAVMQTRLLAHGLVPIGGGPDALQTSLAELAARTNSLGRLRCRFECPDSVTLTDPVRSVHLYRIAQEAVNNALKHARARSVLVRLVRKGSTLVLDITDDGTGLPAGAPKPEGVGVGVMQHRARLIGAGLDVVSESGRGVTIRCTLPLPP